jgi:hypothetical protein
MIMSGVKQPNLIERITLPRGQRSGAMSFLRLVPILLGAGLLFQGGTALAAPRDPWPPLPEYVQGLYQQTFDVAYDYGSTNAQVVANGYTFDESWSGYALRRDGSVTPFLIPAVDSSGCTNLTCNAGAIRFWFQPDWTSASLSGGSGPGSAAVLAEIGVASGNQSAWIWSLQASADGSALSLVAQSDSGPVQLLCAQISWQAGGWHCLVLNSRRTAYFEAVGDPSVPR